MAGAEGLGTGHQGPEWDFGVRKGPAAARGGGHTENTFSTSSAVCSEWAGFTARQLYRGEAGVSVLTHVRDVGKPQSRGSARGGPTRRWTLRCGGPRRLCHREGPGGSHRLSTATAQPTLRTPKLDLTPPPAPRVRPPRACRELVFSLEVT